MTSEEDVPPAGTTSPGSDRELLSREDTRLIQLLCRAMRNEDFKKSVEDPWMTTSMPPVSISRNINGRGSQPARKHASVDPNPNDSNASPESANDREVDTIGDVRSDTPALETEKPMSDAKDGREDEKKSVAVQTTATPDADAAVTSGPSFDAGGAMEERNKPEVDIHHELYKRFKDVYDKLHLLENAISRLGGVENVLSGIRELRTALFLALHWENSFWLRMHCISFEPGDLAEDGTVFRSGTEKRGETIRIRSEVELLLRRIKENANTMRDAFNELGTVNGCQFVSLRANLRAVSSELFDILQAISGSGSGSDMKRLFQNLPKPMSALSDEISKAIERDIPNLRTAEQRLTDRYTNMSTTATFFSSITITAIQISSPMTGNELKDAVNTVWFTSLVFSIGSVIVSLLGLSWFQSPIPMRVGEEKTLKKRVIFLLRNGPVMLMTAAAATFMLGLALFVNSSGQARSTSIVTSSFIALISVVLIFLVIYFAVLSGAAAKLWTNVTRFVSLQRDTGSRLWRERKWIFRRLSYKMVSFGRGVWEWVTRFVGTQINTGQQVWRNVSHFVDLRKHEATKIDFSLEDHVEARPEDFLSVADSDFELLDPGTIQVTLGEFNGPLAVANSGTSSLQIYNAFDDTSPIPNTTVSTPLGSVKDLLWSPDENNLLVRTENGLNIWSEENNDLRPISTSLDPIDSDSIKVAIWTSNSNILAISSKSLIHIDLDTGDADDPKDILNHYSIISAQHIEDERLVCIADDNSFDIPVRKLLVMDHTTGDIVYEGIEIQKTSYSLQLSEGEGLTKILLSFADGSAPQLWHLREVGLRSWEMEFKFNYGTGEFIQHSQQMSNCPASFAGSRNGLVVYGISTGNDAKAEKILIWSADDATLQQSIDITAITSNSGFSNCISWQVDDSVTPTTLALAVACNNGKVVKGKINLSDSIAD